MRKIYLDNVRFCIVVSVIFYHVFYMFNSLGIIRNVNIEGIPQFDVVLYVLYPWFMVCLFVIAGMSAKYALEKKTLRQFFKARIRKILLPSVAGIFLLGWISGWVTGQYNDMFGTVQLPGFLKYLIRCLSGIGPLWFLHELMLAYLVLALLLKTDRKNRLLSIGEKTSLPALFLLSIAVWGSAQVLNTPLLEIYRNGIYLFTFLLGYFVFSHEKVQELLKKRAFLFLGIAALLCIVYTVSYWGENYSEMQNLKSLLTNLYAWSGTLGALSFGIRFLDRETAFTRYMRKNSFAFYVLHYPLMALTAYLLDFLFQPPALAMYVLVALAEAVLLPLLTEIVRRIPVAKWLLLGE